MSSIAEFYSRNLATEVIKGMSQKAAKGGTIGKAPIGYLNTVFRDEVGREVRGVSLDADRSALVEWAFKAYASGDWTITQLADELWFPPNRGGLLYAASRSGATVFS